MLLLYIMYKNGIIEEDRRKLLAHARISYEENDAINNTLLFGVKLIRVIAIQLVHDFVVNVLC